MKYIGNELELFSYATAWKKYYSGIIEPYLHGSILEVGGGIGATTPYLVTRQTSAITILEPDAELHEQLKRVIQNTCTSLSVVTNCATVSMLPNEPLYDAIVYIDVLEHISDDCKELESACWRLKPGGYLVVLSPAFEVLRSEFDDAVGHFRRYTIKTLKGVMPKCCSPVYIRYLDGIGALLSLGNRLMLRNALPTLNQIQFWNKYVIPISRSTDVITSKLWGRSVLLVARKETQDV